MLLVRNFVYDNSEREVLVEDTDMAGDVFGYDLSLFPEEERDIIIKASEILKDNKKFYRHYKSDKIKPHKIIEKAEEQQFTKKSNGVIINI